MQGLLHFLKIIEFEVRLGEFDCVFLRFTKSRRHNYHSLKSLEKFLSKDQWS